MGFWEFVWYFILASIFVGYVVPLLFTLGIGLIGLIMSIFTKE